MFLQMFCFIIASPAPLLTAAQSRQNAGFGGSDRHAHHEIYVEMRFASASEYKTCHICLILPSCPPIAHQLPTSDKTQRKFEQTCLQECRLLLLSLQLCDSDFAIMAASQYPPFSFSLPSQYDLSTYIGRVRHFYTLTDPRTLLASDAEVWFVHCERTRGSHGTRGPNVSFRVILFTACRLSFGVGQGGARSSPSVSADRSRR